MNEDTLQMKADSLQFNIIVIVSLLIQSAVVQRQNNKTFIVRGSEKTCSQWEISLYSSKVFIFRAISVEMLEIVRFRTLVRHHSKMEGCIAKGNSIILGNMGKSVDIGGLELRSE